jgi:hypothetical protein
MEQFFSNQQIPLVQVIDPNTGQQYYVPAATAYNDRNGPNPTILKSVTVDQAISASYISGSAGRAISASYALTASYISTLNIPSLQQVVNTGNSLVNFGGLGTASLLSVNFVNNRSLYLNNDAYPTIRLVDNNNASNNLQIDIDTISLDGTPYNWSDIVNSTASYATTSSYALTHETTVSTYICTGKLSTNQIILSSSDNVIKFSRDIDPNSWLSGTPNFKVTPTYPGYYSVSAGVWFENPNDITSQLNLQGRKNGSTFAIFQTPANNVTGQSLTFTKTIYLNGTTDYIDFSVYQGTPANISLITGSALSSGTWFSMNLITM